MSRLQRLSCLLAAVVLAGCGSSSGGSGDGSTADGKADGGGVVMGVDSGIMLNDAGCLTFASASAVCGFKSDGGICAFSVGCGNSTNTGQCQIDCEMGTTVMCYSAKDVSCLEQAAAAHSCGALTACGWIL